MLSAEFRIETLRCRMLRPRRPANRWDAPIRRRQTRQLLELIGYVEAACRFVLNGVPKDIEKNHSTGADQTISVMWLVAYEFTGGCCNGYIKDDLRPGSRLRQDP